MPDEAPPPVVESDKHLHRRTLENTARRHERWYDSTRTQIIGIGAAFMVLGGSFAVGYALRDKVRTVEGTPIRWQDHLAAEVVQWEAINRNTQGVADLTDRLDFALSLLAEVHCSLQTEDAATRRRCRSDETARRLEEMRQRRQTP